MVFLHMVDYKQFDRAFGRFQFEAKLVLQSL